MDRHLPPAPASQQAFEFVRRGPRLPRGVLCECRGLLTRLLVGVFLGNSDQREEEEPT